MSKLNATTYIIEYQIEGHAEVDTERRFKKKCNFH